MDNIPMRRFVYSCLYECTQVCVLRVGGGGGDGECRLVIFTSRGSHHVIMTKKWANPWLLAFQGVRRWNPLAREQYQIDYTLDVTCFFEGIYFPIEHHSLVINLLMTSSSTSIIREPGPRFNLTMSSYRYRKSHCGDKTVVRSSHLHNGISYTGKMSSSYWTSP